MIQHKVESDFRFHGYRCVVIGQSMGHRCGYVGIPRGHKLYGVPYDEINVDVHGGLTFGETYNTYPVENKEGLYYIGFDCGHYGDNLDVSLMEELTPKHQVELRKMCLLGMNDDVNGYLWTREDVENELKHMVIQIKEIENN